MLKEIYFVVKNIQSAGNKIYFLIFLSLIVNSFGSGIVSEKTGILLNSGMDDFGLPSQYSYFGIPHSENNLIEPGKRPLSSMSPTILVDANNDVKMIIGAAGGTKITTAIAFV